MSQDLQVLVKVFVENSAVKVWSLGKETISTTLGSITLLAYIVQAGL